MSMRCDFQIWDGFFALQSSTSVGQLLPSFVVVVVVVIIILELQS